MRENICKSLIFQGSIIHNIWGFTGGSVVKESACDAGDPGSIPGSGRCLGEGNGNPLRYSCLGNAMDRGAWRAAVHGIANSWTWLSMHAGRQVSIIFNISLTTQWQKSKQSNQKKKKSRHLRINRHQKKASRVKMWIRTSKQKEEIVGNSDGAGRRYYVK